MFCCSIDSNPSTNNISTYPAKKRDASITAIALSALALFLLAVSFILFGVGNLDPGTIMGLGAFAYLGGTFLSLTALGVIAGALVFGGMAAFHSPEEKEASHSLPFLSKLC